MTVLSLSCEELEARCIRLEESLAFQDVAINELNSALIAQQTQLDVAEKRLEAVEKRFRELWDATQQNGGSNEPPPHYGHLA